MQGKWSFTFSVLHTLAQWQQQKHAFTSYTAEYANHSLPFQTYTAKTYKPSWVHEIWMISWWILCTKASLWLVANIANTDLTAELGPWEQNETRLVKTASEREWLQGSVCARKVTDNHNVRVDMPDKSDWLCRFKHIGCTKSPLCKPRINSDYWSQITVIRLLLFSLKIGSSFKTHFSLIQRNIPCIILWFREKMYIYSVFKKFFIKHSYVLSREKDDRLKVVPQRSTKIFLITIFFNFFSIC